ncbi:hypothetical protein [Dactylosporangium salmoneum]|uniref:Zinc finger CGNR domain-containing protein n=1 Tax=Dactylosporangium salmoneum TaxID=53361 RepID=A0ABN3FL65_9ACTN
MATDEDLIEVARTVRSYLSQLGLSRPDAADLDRALGEALARAGGPDDRAAEIMALLERDERVRGWAADFLRGGGPPDVVDSDRGAPVLAGRGEWVARRRFACPEGDYVWWQRTVGQRTPSCPTHAVALIPAQR